MKKTVKLIAMILAFVMITSTLFTSCAFLDGLFADDPKPTIPSTTTKKPECKHVDANEDGFCDECGAIVKIPQAEDTFSYYANTKLPEDKKIYVLNMTSEGYAFTEDELTEITDITPLPHNGCRPPKRRRV